MKETAIAIIPIRIGWMATAAPTFTRRGLSRGLYDFVYLSVHEQAGREEGILGGMYLGAHKDPLLRL